MIQGWSSSTHSEEPQSLPVLSSLSTEPLHSSTFDLPPLYSPQPKSLDLNLDLYKALDYINAHTNQNNYYLEDNPNIDKVDPADLFSNPDLCPPTLRSSPPKSLPLSSSKQKKEVVNQINKLLEKEDFNGKVQQDPSHNSEPLKDQIRACLDRVRRRQSSSAFETLTPVRDAAESALTPQTADPAASKSAASFAAGLYRLETLLQKDTGVTFSRDGSPARSRKHTLQSQSEAPESSSVPHQERPRPPSADVSTITDLHQSSQVAEVEIISLVQEQLPLYTLRADPTSEAAGCSRESWAGVVPFPALEDAATPLSPEQAEATLEYFVLCGSRVNQMTKTYNDVEAVTRLLAEKEKDLELAARIGQQLVTRNKALEERHLSLESELAQATEENTQLRHQLTLKTNLLSIYTDDVEDGSRDVTPSTHRNINVDLLEERVRSLQNDNKLLREETNRLAGETTMVEERENNLMQDVFKQLELANSQVSQLNLELRNKNDESLKSHEETTLLLAQVIELEARIKELLSVQEEMTYSLAISRECQNELTTELAEQKDKYSEVLDLLHDTQEQLRHHQGRKGLTSGGMRVGGGVSTSILSHSRLFGSSRCEGNEDSIASELSSLETKAEEEQERVEPSPSRQLNNVHGVLSTVRSSLRATPSSAVSHTPYTPGYTSYTPGYASYTPGYSLSTPGYTAHTPGLGLVGSYGFGRNRVSSDLLSDHPSSLDSGADSDMHTDTEDTLHYPASTMGVPGYPGMPDLNSCVKRIRPALTDVSPSRPTALHSPGLAAELSSTPSRGNGMPYGCRTPDSIMATGGANNSRSAEWPSARGGFNKLQIVKPLEGSETLHKWSKLATPNLGGLLQPHNEGIAHRGGVGRRNDMDLYSLSDFEEDDACPPPTPPPTCLYSSVSSSDHYLYSSSTPQPVGDEPRKQFMHTSGVFTYTNSTIMHVEDNTQLTQMGSGVQTVSSLASSISSFSSPQASLHPAPSRRDSTATFSTNVGLARVLQERGVLASTAHTRGDEPTATPTNSPDGSGRNSPTPGNFGLLNLQDLRSTLMYGATCIRRTLYPSPPSTPSVSESPGEIFKKVSSLPLSVSLVSSLPHSYSHQSIGGVITPRLTSPSPLLHLSNLIRNSKSTPEGFNDLQSPEGPPPPIPQCTVEISSPGARRPPIPSNAPLGVPVEPGMGHLHGFQRFQRRQVRTKRPDLGTVPGQKTSATGPGTMGQLESMSVGRKGGLL